MFTLVPLLGIDFVCAQSSVHESNSTPRVLLLGDHFAVEPTALKGKPRTVPLMAVVGSVHVGVPPSFDALFVPHATAHATHMTK
jgi:hypothetical protein